MCCIVCLEEISSLTHTRSYFPSHKGLMSDCCGATLTVSVVVRVCCGSNVLLAVLGGPGPWQHRRGQLPEPWTTRALHPGMTVLGLGTRVSDV